MLEHVRIFDGNNRHYSNNMLDNEMFLRVQENYFNDKLRAHGVVFLNEIFEALGFPRTRDGQVAGWIRITGDEDRIIEFNIVKIEAPETPEVRFVLNFRPDENVLLALPL